MSPGDGEPSREYPDGRALSQQPHWRQDFATDAPEDDHVSRREFTKFLVLISGAFLTGQCWIALMSLIRQPRPPLERSIARLEGVPDGGVVQFRYPTQDDPCVLIRLGGDRLVAYSQACTHLSCAVIPEPEKGWIHCPCHEGYFDLENGRPIAGPPVR